MKNPSSVLGLALLTLSTAGGSTARADPRIYNASPDSFKVIATLPNGAKESRDLSSGSSSLTSEGFTLSYAVKEIKVELLDDAGASVWKGVVKVNDTFVVLPEKKGIKVVFSGFSGSKDTPRAVAIMNATGDPVTVDLEGRNGLAASRGIVPGASFEPKKAVKLDARESTYGVKATVKGAEVPLESTVLPGRYLLVWKNATGAYHADSIGTIAE